MHFARDAKNTDLAEKLIDLYRDFVELVETNQQVGGDGIQACASCHFQAGADVRSVNQLNPGHNAAFNVGGPNHTDAAADFPYHQLATPDDPKSAVTRDLDDVHGSQGVHNTLFNDISGAGRDNISVLADPTFNVGGVNTRRVTGRNTPTAINAIFNVRNFHDGRANNMFNGRNPFGAADANAGHAQGDVAGRDVLALGVDDLGSLGNRDVLADAENLAVLD